jgi:Fic family protein
MPSALFDIPTPDDRELAVLGTIDGLRERLSGRVAEPRRWSGNLRRMTLARNVQASNEIEGYNATLDDAAATVDGDTPLDADTETQLALAGYRDAMTYILQLARDNVRAPIDESLIRSLHFMMMKHDLELSPGLWRTGPIRVERQSDGTVVYTGPDATVIPKLITAMREQLAGDRGPVLIRAAMAHLNLVMVHPFRDGNGRMGRALQTLVLAQEGVLSPVFSSVEEYLGRNTQAYYDALAQVGGGSWSPDRDARPWVRFCLTAHLRQALTLERRVDEAEGLWTECADLATTRGLPERVVGALWDAAIGRRIRNATYRAIVSATHGEEVSFQMASRDLQRLVTAGYLTAVGDHRGRHYRATDKLGDTWRAIRARRPTRWDADPFDPDAPHPQQLTL